MRFEIPSVDRRAEVFLICRAGGTLRGGNPAGFCKRVSVLPKSNSCLQIKTGKSIRISDCLPAAYLERSDLEVAGTPTIVVFKPQHRGSPRPVPMDGEHATGGGHSCTVECFSLRWIVTGRCLKGSDMKGETGAAGCKRREL
ncbi:hypothetical protein KIL84_023002 [Mauremys mutica]|uniref:Uncharacterized protein n=1 Tax=Mauremys mutica TaxID=74926 RepID=A0A9D3WQF9_9SAUR|nr:hypothetical protein KIL84_023002 [Mauremys mutica]